MRPMFRENGSPVLGEDGAHQMEPVMRPKVVNGEEVKINGEAQMEEARQVIKKEITVVDGIANESMRRQWAKFAIELNKEARAMKDSGAGASAA